MSIPLHHAASRPASTGWQRLLQWLTHDHQQRYASCRAEDDVRSDAWFWQLSDLACAISSADSLQQLPQLLEQIQSTLAQDSQEAPLQALVLPQAMPAAEPASTRSDSSTDTHRAQYDYIALTPHFSAPVNNCSRLLRQPEQWLAANQQLLPFNITQSGQPNINGWLLVQVGEQHGAERQATNRLMPRLTELLQRLQQGLSGWYQQQQRLQQAVADERRAHAAELHDSLAQSLAYTRMQSARLASQLTPESSASQQAKEVEQLCHYAYRQTRELIATARLTTSPNQLANSLEQLIDEFEQRTAMVFELDIRADLSALALNEQTSTQLMYIVRESVCNLVRHAHASHASIRLFRDLNRGADHGEPVLICQIEDNGKGIRGKGRSDSFGIQIMKERAQRIGAVLNIGTRPEGQAESRKAESREETPQVKGTRVELVIPLAQDSSIKPARPISTNNTNKQ